MVTFADGSSAVSATSRTANISAVDNRLAESDDSFFSTWLASSSQSQEAGHSPSGSRSPPSPKHPPLRQTQSASLKTTKLFPRTIQSETADHRDEASDADKQFHHGSSSERSAVLKLDEKKVTHPLMQPISVNISNSRQAKSENTNVAGLLISTNTDETANTSLFDENVALDKESSLDVRKNDLPETSVDLYVSEDGTDGSRDEYRSVLSAESNPEQLDTSASSRHFNSQLSSSILSPEPDELFGMEGDVQPEGGWSDNAEMWLSSTIDLPEAETADISTVESLTTTTKSVGQTDDGNVDLQADVVDSVVDESEQISDETSMNISTDMSNVLSTDSDVKPIGETPSLEGSVKEISSLEGSLEASADELSEGNTIVLVFFMYLIITLAR